MDTLTIEPTYRVVLGNINRFRIMVVGAGGTGSTLALFLAGLAYHARQKGIQVELTLVDHDVVELKNCGRQAVSLQSALAGGVPKVADLALRLNAAYGLDIAAWPQPYIMDMARGWFHHGAGGRSRAHPGDLVDNHRLRRRGQSSGLDQPQQQNQKEHGQKKWDKSVSSLLVNLDGPLL